MTIIASLGGAWNTVQNTIRGINLSSVTRIKDSIQVDRFVGLLKSVDYGNLAFAHRYPIAGTVVASLISTISVRRIIWYRKEATYVEAGADGDISLRGACQVARRDIQSITDYIQSSIIEQNEENEYQFRTQANAATVANLLEKTGQHEGAAHRRLLKTRSEIQQDRAVRNLLRQIHSSHELQRLSVDCQDETEIENCRESLRNFLDTLRPQLVTNLKDTSTNVGILTAKSRLLGQINVALRADRHTSVEDAIHQISDLRELSRVVKSIDELFLGFGENDVAISMNDIDPQNGLLRAIVQARRDRAQAYQEANTEQMQEELTNWLRAICEQNDASQELKILCGYLLDPKDIEGDVPDALTQIFQTFGSADAVPLQQASPEVLYLYLKTVQQAGVEDSEELPELNAIVAFRQLIEQAQERNRRTLLHAVDSVVSNLRNTSLYEESLSPAIAQIRQAIEQSYEQSYEQIGDAPLDDQDDRLQGQDPIATVNTFYQALAGTQNSSTGLIAELNEKILEESPARKLRGILVGIEQSDLDQLQNTLKSLISRSTLAGTEDLNPDERERRQRIANDLGVAALAAARAAANPEDNERAEGAATLSALKEKTDKTFRSLSDRGYLGLWSWAAIGIAAGTATWTAPRWLPTVQAFYQNIHHKLFRPLNVPRAAV